jgi:hypothetical protein
MRKIAVAGAVLAGLLALGMAAPVALAQEGDTGPGTAACTDAAKEVNKQDRALRDAEDALVTAEAALIAAENDPEASDADVDKARKERNKARDARDDARRLLDTKLAEQAEACAAEDPAPTTTPAPTTEPAPPVIDFVDLDCGDFPRPDGTSAQTVLNQDAADPHKLDANNNGVACEGGGVDVEDTSDNDNDIDVDVDVDVPSGAVDTGGGPA